MPSRSDAISAGLFRNRTYLLLFSAQLISLLGSGVTTVALALLAYQLTGGDNAGSIIGTALMLRILAFLIFSQPAGVLADRLPRKPLLISADLVRAALLALFPFVTEIWQVYGLIFAINAATAFFTPTFEALLPGIVGEKHYVKALALSRLAVDVEAVLAPLIAGLLVAGLGLSSAFWFDAASYLVSALLVALAVIPRLTSGSRIAPRFWSELGAGTRILFREAALRRALLFSVAEATAGAAAIVATIVYVMDILGESELTFTIVMACVGLGSSLAALGLSRVTQRLERRSVAPAIRHGMRHRWSGYALFVGGCLLVIALLPGIALPGLLAFGLLWLINGAGQALIAVSSATLLAEHAAESERGRAYAAHFAWTHGFWLISYPAIGFATSRLGAPLTLTAAGILCAAIVSLAWWLPREDVSAHTH